VNNSNETSFKTHGEDIELPSTRFSSSQSGQGTLFGFGGLGCWWIGDHANIHWVHISCLWYLGMWIKRIGFRLLLRWLDCVKAVGVVYLTKLSRTLVASVRVKCVWLPLMVHLERQICSRSGVKLVVLVAKMRRWLWSKPFVLRKKSPSLGGINL